MHAKDKHLLSLSQGTLLRLLVTQGSLVALGLCEGWRASTTTACR